MTTMKISRTLSSIRDGLYQTVSVEMLTFACFSIAIVTRQKSAKKWEKNLDDNGRCMRLQQQAQKLSNDITKLRDRQANRQRELDSVSVTSLFNANF